ncbi:MAG: hypothetical protein HYU80_01580 [Candidatus Blackburnbacteria bacterium]|nr:hypothetical protein [Candidatus Blackburnbacteria bacterium]
MSKTAYCTTSAARNRIKLRHFEAQARFRQRHPHASEFFQKVGVDPGKIREHSARLLTAGALGGALLLAPGISVSNQQNQVGQPPSLKMLPLSSTANPLVLPAPIVPSLEDAGKVWTTNPQEWLTYQLGKLLPPITNRWGLPFLSREEEKIIEKVVERATGVPAKATLEGERLNTVYGYIGAEQHLARYPGDTMAGHELKAEGMAPGLGGWGYFTVAGKLTSDAIEREKYYVAVQTLYLPDWGKRVKYLAQWYKWRKVIVVDVERGTAVVAVVGDAGPAAWTGKHFGGSPEVMYSLGGPRYKKGRVLLYFVDDPENKIQLGPVDYNKLNVPMVKSI